MKPKSVITVIGSANVDFIMQVPKLPVMGETVTDGTFFQTFGGKGANQAVAAARAGGQVTFVGALGSDPLAQAYLKSLQDDGLDTRFVSMEPDLPGGSALVMFDKQGDNYLTVAPGSNHRITPERVRQVEELIAKSDWIVLQQEIPMESNLAVLELAKMYQTPVLLNYAPAHDLRLKPGSAVHGLIVNEHEAGALAGQKLDTDNAMAVAVLAESLKSAGGHQFVIITLGKAGAVIADRSGIITTAAFKVQAVDTTAAGDTFCGALAVALGEGRDLNEAARFASAASALSVMKMGAQSSIPDRVTIDQFLQS